jgi:3-hydroxybutyryl-CoA dehydrogenase
MKKQTIDTTETHSPAAAVAGDEELVHEMRALLEARGIEAVDALDHRALKAAAPRIQAAFELSVLSSDRKKDNLLLLDAQLQPAIPIISSSVCITALSQAQWIGGRSRLIGFSGFPTMLAAPLVDVAPTLYTTDAALRETRTVFSALGRETVVVQDRAGMITPGIIAQIVNEALMTVQQNVASASDIDAAMKLGAGYALGPIEHGEAIGFAYIAALLDAMREETGEERFRTCTLLRQLARSGKFWRARPVAVQEELLLEPQTESALEPAQTEAVVSTPAKKKSSGARKAAKK